MTIGYPGSNGYSFYLRLLGGAMKISIYSRSTLERKFEHHEIDQENTAIVSFADSVDDFIEFPDGTNVMKIAFYDIGPYSIPTTDYYRVLPEAKDIAKFVDTNIKQGKNLICQCDYGVSRSAGLAAAIMEHYKKEGVKLFADYRYTPNKFVFNKVLAALNLLNKK